MTENEFNKKLSLAKLEFEKLLNSSENKAQPLANYITSKKSGNNIYISGQLPKDLINNNEIITGHIDSEDTNKHMTYNAKYAATMSAMQILLILKNEIKDLSKIKSCVQLQVFVNSNQKYTNQHLVANGASDLICEYLPQNTSKHTRCAIGVSSLPLGAIVEVNAIFEI